MVIQGAQTIPANRPTLKASNGEVINSELQPIMTPPARLALNTILMSNLPIFLGKRTKADERAEAKRAREVFIVIRKVDTLATEKIALKLGQ